jgi:hypothetical protein
MELGLDGQTDIGNIPSLLLRLMLLVLREWFGPLLQDRRRMLVGLVEAVAAPHHVNEVPGLRHRVRFDVAAKTGHLLRTVGAVLLTAVPVPLTKRTAPVNG